jgi:lipoprotein Spr
MKKILTLICFVFFLAFSGKSQTTVPLKFQELVKRLIVESPLQTPSGQLISFARTLIGIPYRYASSNPDSGFDCSGFVNYVFENFGFKVPRSSREFPDAGIPVNLENAKVGDVLIFTGTNPRIRKIGHVGIICSIDGDQIQFIHATSGKAHGVTVTDMNDYYKSRFMKAVSIL